MDPWMKDLQAEVFEIIKEEMKNWGEIVNTLVLDEENRKDWMSFYKAQTREHFSELTKDITDTRDKVLSNIDTLLKKASSLCKQLGVKIPDYGSGNLGLYIEERELRQKIQDLEKEVKTRLDIVREVMVRQEYACEVLGRELVVLSENPLSTEDQVEVVLNHVINLEDDIQSRKEKYAFIKFEIITMSDELRVEPSLDFEQLVVYGDINCFEVTDANMELLEKYRVSLLQKTKEVTEEILKLREKIEFLWEILSEDKAEGQAFLESVKGYSLNSLRMLKDEVNRCEELKKANLEVFIEKIRTEIQEYWDKCFYGEEQKQEFQCFYDDLFTEDLLTLHDLQLERLKKYYETNKELIDLIGNYEKLWAKLHELDERASRPDRYKNRGGQLLKEEKERNSVEKRIPILEEKMLSLAAEYEIKNNKPFLYKGESLELKINKYQENYEQEKKSKLTALKQKRDITIAHSKASTSSTSNLTRLGTPMKLGISTFRTPAKRNALTPNFSESKKLKLTHNATKTAPSKIQRTVPKIVVNPATPANNMLNNSKRGKNRVKLTYSTEKKKKIRRSKRLSKVIANLSTSQKKPVEDQNYNFFEAEISSKSACRSTIYEPEIPKPHKATPYKSDLKLKNNKLTSAPVLKMEF